MTIRFVACLFCLFATVTSVAQVNVRGTVIDRAASEPLVAASVVVKGTDGKIKKFANTRADGTFAMQLPTVSGCRLEVAMMGYVRQSLSLDTVSFPLTVYMEAGQILLKEVTVKADRIRENGDTITYNVGSFAQLQDRTIGDVLRRMPGIDVEKSGKIQYQGEDINKFYIEGSDLLGGKYGIATNGISSNDVGAVEVMENHQPMQVLSGISFSDKAAINLKLKNKAKAAWSFHGSAGGGWSWQPTGTVWNGELFAMAVMPKFQNITTFRTNNTGEDLSASSSDFFTESRGTELERYVGIELPHPPSLDERRTLFNRSFLLSTNNLWKLKNGELKANIDYSYQRVANEASSVTTYFLDEGNRTVTENRSGTQHKYSLSGKLVYELNQKKSFVNNTLQTNIDRNDISLRTSGSIPNTQSADLPDYYVSNCFKMIQRFGGKHLVTFESRNEWESLPQTLCAELQNFPYSQHIIGHAFFSHESAAYAFTLKGLSVGMEGGVKGYWRAMNSELSSLPDTLGGATTNAVSTNYVTVYATPRVEYGARRFNVKLDVPVSYAHYFFHEAIRNRNEMFCSPSLSLNWKPSNRFSSTLRGRLGRSPMSLSLIHPGLVMTDYRTLKSGVDDFYCSTSQSVSASFRYKHARHGLFANGMVIHTWNRLPYTLAQQLYGDYAVYTYTASGDNAKSLMAIGSIGKTLDFMHGSCSINGSYNRTNSRLLSQSQSVQSVSTNWTVGGKINGSPCGWFSFDLAAECSNSRITMNRAAAPWLTSITNKLGLNFFPHPKWEWQTDCEHYLDDLTEGTCKNNVMLDTKIIYKPAKRVELSASLTNILDKRQYNYTIYSQLSSVEIHNQLQGRQLLFQITLR